MQKYEEGLTDEQLTNKINEIGEEIEERENPDISQAIVDGYIFSVDRTVPKILDYLGPADGIIITATVSGNGGWFRPGETNIIVTGKIKTYSGGNITTVSATKDGTAILDFSIDGDGRYTIDNITEDTTIVINAEDSKDKKGSKTVPITIRIDTIPPVVDSIDARAERLTIKFTATGHDNESGMKHFNYMITSTQDTTLEGIPADKKNGTFTPGQTIEITTTPTGNREETTYTITVTATDNADNTTLSSEAKMAQVVTIDGITVAEAKQITAETIQENIGKRVIDYEPLAGGKWRVFYCDTGDADNPQGFFGDGIGTIYLKRDYDLNQKMKLNSHNAHVPSDGGILMRRLNPAWSISVLGQEIDTEGEHCAAWLCDTNVWNELGYKTDDAKYVIGGTSLEMYIRAYNVFRGSELLECEIREPQGYVFGTDGELGVNCSMDFTGGRGVFGDADYLQWLCSPGFSYVWPGGGTLAAPYATYIMNLVYDTVAGICPVACLK